MKRERGNALWLWAVVLAMPAGLAAGADLIGDGDFEAQAVGDAFAAPWTQVLAGSEVVQGFAGNNTRLLHAMTAAGGDNIVSQPFSRTIADGVMAMAAEVNVVSTGGGDWRDVIALGLVNEPGERAVMIEFVARDGVNGMLNYFDAGGGGDHPVDNLFTPGQWFTVEFRFDMLAHVYDTYVNDALVDTARAFRPRSNLNLTGVQIFNWASYAGNGYVDNLYIQDTGAISHSVPGDANGDGVCDVGDLGILGAHYNQATTLGAAEADFNNDGMCDVGDLGILGANYTTSAAVPEPATLSLLGLGVLALCRRR